MAKKNAKTPALPTAPKLVAKPLDEASIKAGALLIETALVGIQKAGDTFCTVTRDYIAGLDFTNSKTALFAVASLTEVLQGKFDDKLAMLKTLIYNAEKVVRGGMVKKLVVKGKGQAALVKVLQGQTNINEMRAAIADAKPAQLKPAPNAANTAAKTAKAATPASHKPGVVKVTSAPDAFAAAVAILRQCHNFLSAGADANLIGQIEALVRELQGRALKKAA